MWGWVPKPSVSLFDAREGWWVVETPPSHRNARREHGGSPISHLDVREGRGGVERWRRDGGGDG